jgi:iron complex outermembrane receptor protein
MGRSLKALLCASAGAASLLTAGAVRAADATDSAAAQSASQVGELVVTAQRREESVQAIPASISAISGATLDARGIETVNDLQFAVPSFHSGTLTGGTNISIRGVGATTGGPGVAENVDGVYQTQTSVADLAQVDLQRVEVLRGPQGTLYGRNANAGAVNFITNAPSDRFGGSLLAGYAQYDQYHLQGIINAPLGEALKTRLVVDYNDRQQGFVSNVTPGGESLDRGSTLSARFRASVTLSSSLDFDLGVSALHSHGPWEYLTNYNTPAPVAFAANPFLVNANFITQPWKTDDNDPVGGTRDYQSVSGTFTWRLPFGELKSITAFQNYAYAATNDGDGANLSVAPYISHYWDRSITQELDLSGRWDHLDWVAGFFFLSEKSHNSLFYNFSLGLTGLPPSSYLDFENPRYDTTSYAGFADGTYHVTDSLKLIAGLRYSDDQQVAVYGNSFGLVLKRNPGPPRRLLPAGD